MALTAEAGAQPPGVSVVVVKAVHGCFASAVRFTGEVVPRAEAIVSLNPSGYEISAIYVAEGDSVTAGQVLARLSPLAVAPGGAPAAALVPGEMPLRAPEGGKISSINARVGDVAAALPLPPPLGPKPAFRIIVGDKLEVEADVLSFDLVKLKAGQPARIRLDSGLELSGHVRAMWPEVDRKTQLGKVRVTIDREPGIRAGMFARGTIDASHSCGVSIPRAAVVYESQGTTVGVVHDNAVETRHIRIGLFSQEKIEVLDGVKEGELIIANAGTSLHDGDRVKPILADDPGE